MVWVKVIHISALILWCAGLIYMPLLHSRQRHVRSRSQFSRLRVMSRYLYVVVASPAAIITIVSGGTLVYLQDATTGWLAAKLGVVSLMALFHARCGHVLMLLGHESGRSRHRASAWVVLIPAILISSVLWLVLTRPSTWLDNPIPIAALMYAIPAPAHAIQPGPSVPRCSLFPHDAQIPACRPASPLHPPGPPSAEIIPIPAAVLSRLEKALV